MNDNRPTPEETRDMRDGVSTSQTRPIARSNRQRTARARPSGGAGTPEQSEGAEQIAPSSAGDTRSRSTSLRHVMFGLGASLVIIACMAFVATWSAREGELGTKLIAVAGLVVCGLLWFMAGARVSRARTSKTMKVNLEGHRSYYARKIVELTRSEQDWLSERDMARLSHGIMGGRLAKRLIQADIDNLDNAWRTATQTYAIEEVKLVITLIYRRGNRRREGRVSVDDLSAKKARYQALGEKISLLLDRCEQPLREQQEARARARRAREEERARARRARQERARLQEERLKQMEGITQGPVEKEDDQAGTRTIPPNVRQAVLDRDDYICRYCGRHSQTMEVDHVTPVSQGGESTLGNLVTACRDCNRKKAGRTPEEAGMEVLPVRTRRRDWE